MKMNSSMTDLVDREDVIALIVKAIHGTDNKETQGYLFNGLRKMAWALPAVSAVEVVRCVDCKHWISEIGACSKNMLITEAMEYCSDGERRE